MKECIASGHPDCKHKCISGTCIAIYDHTTRLCKTSCDGEGLAASLAESILISGWTGKTSLQAKGILGYQVRLISNIPDAILNIRDTQDGLGRQIASESLVFASKISRITDNPAILELKFSFEWEELYFNDALMNVVQSITSNQSFA